VNELDRPSPATLTIDPKARVFVVEDDDSVREAIVWMIQASGLRSRAFVSAEEFLAHYDPAAPGCLVLDVRMQGMSGLELQEKLSQSRVISPIIIITGHAQVPMVIHALRQGAFDFLEKPLDMGRLMDSIRRAMESDTQLRARLADQMAMQQRLARLSDREREVLDLVIVGRLNKQIARDLHLSERTVEKYRASLLRKMEVDSTAQAIYAVLQARLADSAPKP
jgi:FixJ family two-component response regulator